MNDKTQIRTYTSMKRVTERARDDLKNGGQDFVLLYAYNRTGRPLKKTSRCHAARKIFSSGASFW